MECQFFFPLHGLAQLSCCVLDTQFSRVPMIVEVVVCLELKTGYPLKFPFSKFNMKTTTYYYCIVGQASCSFFEE